MSVFVLPAQAHTLSLRWGSTHELLQSLPRRRRCAAPCHARVAAQVLAPWYCFRFIGLKLWIKFIILLLDTNIYMEPLRMICKYLLKLVSFSLICKNKFVLSPSSAQMFRDITMLTDLLLLVYSRRLQVQIMFHSRFCLWLLKIRKKLSIFHGQICL